MKTCKVAKKHLPKQGSDVHRAVMCDKMSWQLMSCAGMICRPCANDSQDNAETSKEAQESHMTDYKLEALSGSLSNSRALAYSQKYCIPPYS